MLLTCPNCRSGLAVPDGTTALVRCPACKTVFAPAENLAEPEESETGEEEEREERAEPARKPARRPAPRAADDEEEDEAEDERPRRKKPAAKAKRKKDDEDDEDEGEKPRNRDFDPEDPEEERKRRKKKRRRGIDDDKFSPEEREKLRRGFARAAAGCKCIWVSFLLFIISMMLIIMFWFQAALPSLGVSPAYIVASGVIGAVGWVVAAVGVGLCLSGPPAPGHWGYGIAAAIATGVHLVLLLVLVGKANEFVVGRAEDPNGPVASWGLIPTRIDSLTFYLTLLVYSDQEFVPKGVMRLSIIVGLAEMLRTMLILMLLSCLAEAAGDKDLSERCTRAAGIATWGPGVLAAGMLLFAVVVTETRMGVNKFTVILFVTIVMGIYVMIAGCMFPAFMAGRDVADACDEPFQSQIPQL